MAEKIIMPKQGLQMTEGTILEWLIKEGGTVTAGQPLFEMETDKLTITIDAPVEGSLLKIVHPAGDTVPITTVIAYIGQPGEAVEALEPAIHVSQGEAKVAELPQPASGEPALMPAARGNAPLAGSAGSLLSEYASNSLKPTFPAMISAPMPDFQLE